MCDRPRLVVVRPPLSAMPSHGGSVKLTLGRKRCRASERLAMVLEVGPDPVSNAGGGRPWLVWGHTDRWTLPGAVGGASVKSRIAGRYVERIAVGVSVRGGLPGPWIRPGVATGR
ncbi:MAG: hypothetical protein ACLUEV_05490 [Alistipes sp.]